MRLDLDLRAGGRLHPHVLAVPHAAIVGVLRVDLDEVLLLQLGEPRIAARLVAAAFVFDQAAAREDQREVLRDVFRRRSCPAPTCTASAGARTPSCRRASGTWRPGPGAASTAARGAAECRRGSSTRWRAPSRCRTDGSRASSPRAGCRPTGRSSSSCLRRPSSRRRVSSSHQPSFFSSTWSNSG